MMDTLSMLSGTSVVPRILGVRQSVRLHILLQPQLGQAVVLRSLVHAFQFPCRVREGRHGIHHEFSRWEVGGGGK